MAQFEVEFYRTESNKCPVIDFLDSLDKKMKAKMLLLINVMEEKGNELREPYSKPLDSGIFELRAKGGTDVSRILYFFVIGKKIVLTNGFVKKQNKTPKLQIELAKKYRLDYINRYGGKEMSDFRNYLNKQLQDPEFKKEWDAMQPKFQIIRAMIEARTEQNLTQKKLAEKTGITQADICRLEKGTANPSLKTLQRLADGLGFTLKLEFEKKQPVSATN